MYVYMWCMYNYLIKLVEGIYTRVAPSLDLTHPPYTDLILFRCIIFLFTYFSLTVLNFVLE